MTYVARTNTIEIDTVTRISFAIQALLRSVSNAYVAHRTARLLSQLSTRELDDLGLNRADIKAVAHDATYGH